MNRVERGRWKLVSSSVDRAEAIAGRDEDRRSRRRRARSVAVVGRGAFEQAQRRSCRRRRRGRRGARAALSAAAVAASSSAPFGVHAVAAGVVDLDRQEGAGADMQREAAQRDAGALERRDQLRA